MSASESLGSVNGSNGGPPRLSLDGRVPTIQGLFQFYLQLHFDTRTQRRIAIIAVALPFVVVLRTTS